MASRHHNGAEHPLPTNPAKALFYKILFFIALSSIASCGIAFGPRHQISADGRGSNGKYSDSSPDPLAEYLWHFLNTGQTNYASLPGTPGEDINLGDVHSTYRGEGTTIVISDGRIQLDHPDLATNTVPSLSKNYLASNSPGVDPMGFSPPDDTDAHGTAVMGLAGAVRGNGIGVFGGAPLAKLVGYDFLDSNQSLAKDIDQATGPAGATYNYSYGFPTCSISPVDRTYVDQLWANTALKNTYVTAAGNDYIGNDTDCGGSGNGYLGNSNLDQLKSYPHFIVVGAVSGQGVVTSYSTPGANLWVSAPGGQATLPVMSTDLVGCDKGFATSASTNVFDTNASAQNPNCSFATGMLVGTSFASPITTGIVALLREVCPDCGWREIKDILANTATQVDPTSGNSGHPAGLNLTGYVYQQGWVTNSAGYHFHNNYGFGRLNASAAVAYAKDHTSPLPKEKTTHSVDRGSYYDSGTISVAIPDNSATGGSATLNVDLHDLVIEHVQIRVSITHTYIGDLGIELTSPAGTVSKVMMINSGLGIANLSTVRFGSNAFYGEHTFGTWTIKIVDGAAGDTGTLTNWSLDFLGHGDPALAGAQPAPVTAIGNTGNALSWTHSVSANRRRYEVCVTASTATCDDYKWFNIGSGSTYTATKAISTTTWAALTSGTHYKFRIRTVSDKEVESDVTEYEWTAP